MVESFLMECITIEHQNYPAMINLSNYQTGTGSSDTMSQGSSHGPNEHGDSQLDTGTQILDRVEPPRLYKVLLLNDDYTPMDFVILVLRRFFAKSELDAEKIMMDVHRKGAGLAGVYTLEIAEMKTLQANQFSKSHQHPLKCVFEPESPSTEGGPS